MSGRGAPRGVALPAAAPAGSMAAAPAVGSASDGTRRHVLAAMSGGVDSGVAAALAAEAGHALTGVTLKLWCYGTSPLSPRAC